MASGLLERQGLPPLLPGIVMVGGQSPLTCHPVSLMTLANCGIGMTSPAFSPCLLCSPTATWLLQKISTENMQGKIIEGGQWLVVLVGISPPQTFFVRSLIILLEIFLWFSFLGEGYY